MGEAFDNMQLHALVPNGNYALLLYPPTPHCVPTQLDARRLPPIAPASQITLIVLDATWRKSRKMLHNSPGLQHLPRLGLENQPPSAYSIRKAHAPSQLSTLEATCTALAQLEGNADRFDPLRAALKGFVKRLETQASNLQGWPTQ